MAVKGKRVVITGANGRLGRMLVHRFATEGARVVAVVRRPEVVSTLPFPSGAEGWAYPFDVTREAEVVAGFRQIREDLGGMDVLIHTVGTWAGQPFLETSYADWTSLFETNLHSTFLCFREALRIMQGPEGRLIAFASRQGALRGAAQQAAYSAAKAGVIRLVEALAAELGRDGPTVHAIAPSLILYPGMEEQHGVRAEDLVEACLYLCSPTGRAHHGGTLPAYGSVA